MGTNERQDDRLTNAATKPKDGVGGHDWSIRERSLFGQEPLGPEVVDVAKGILISAHGPIHGE
jgi:hypothetical protein